MPHPEKCHPHYCAFDSPACPEKCSSDCRQIKPQCVSVTAQQAMNMPEKKILRSKNGIPKFSCSTRERVFGIPYDPRKDFDVEVPQEIVDQYIQATYDSMNDGILKRYISGTCCAEKCRCSLQTRCACRNIEHNCMKSGKGPGCCE